jgi:hypothetical protein
MDDLLPIVELYAEVALDAIRRPFPFPRSRKLELVAVRKALDRLVQGETGTPMTPQEAVTYLRGRIEAGAQALAGREKRYCPHLTTWVNQRRYLAFMPQETPKNLEEAISVLSCYPTITTVDVDAHMPILKVIDQHIEYWRATHGAAAASYLRQRTHRYAEIVARWPREDLQFVPNPLRWFTERRYEQRDELWGRTPKAGFESERSRLHLIA